MAKHVNIPINGPIGEFTDEWGFMTFGFMPYIVDYLVGYDYENMSIGAPDLEHVTFRINSDGGGVVEGFEILAKMEALKEKGVLVEVINESRAYSIASLLLQGASAGQRKSRPYALFMAHKPWGGPGGGNADQLRAYANYLDDYEKPMARVYAQASGKTEEEIFAFLREEKFMTPEETKAYGLLDEVLPFVNADKAAAPENIEKKAVAYYKPQNSNKSVSNMELTAEETSLWKEIKAFLGGKKADNPKPAAAKPAATNKPKPKPKATEPAASTEGDVVAESTTLADDGGTIYHDGALAEGVAVFADAEMTDPLEDGAYDLSDGREIEVADGVVSNITEAEEEEEEAAASASADTEDTPKPAASAKKPQPKNAELVALQRENAKLKAQLDKVPGGGNSTQKPPQSFNASDKGAGGAPDIKAFDAAAEKMKKKLKLN